MTFEVRLSQRAQADLEGLPRAVQVRIVAKLAVAGADPARHFRRLKGSKLVRLRVGDYRVLAEVDAKRQTISVHHIGNRKNVYE